MASLMVRDAGRWRVPVVMVAKVSFGELRAESFEVRATAAGSGRRENLVLPGETK